jgi:hypothetical protein
LRCMVLQHFNFEMLYARHADAWLAAALPRTISL